MEALFICYPKCSTCKKAEEWLNKNGISYNYRHIVEKPVTLDEITQYYKTSGLPLKRFFNTSGLLYRELDLKDKLENMSEQDQLELLTTNGMLVKRPILIYNGKVLVGFKEKEWHEIL